MENKLINKKNITFAYAKDLIPHKAWEQKFTDNINLWLGQYADAINHQDGTIEVFFDNAIKQHIHLQNMPDDLQNTLHQQLSLFQTPRNKIKHRF
ncbi:MAG TPA: hypothetical protein VKR53_11700 [Puia sp.]|nr:hypothetical protein [Puia sp.]